MSFENPRINDINMSKLDIVMALGEGNPGGIRVMADIIRVNESVDPDDAFGPLGPLFELDNLDCYGSRIWMLYKDVCKENIVMMLGVLRGIQLGIVEAKDVNKAIENYGEGIDPRAILVEVQKTLPNFGKLYETV